MTSSRTPGRYHLHRLGWSAFEDLCLQIMRVALGETCARFRPGPDGGRDGWFQGRSAGLLVTQNRLDGNFIVQCKHTSRPCDALGNRDLKKETEKLQKIAKMTPCHYILMTNRQVSAQGEAAIRETIEAISGVGRCLVLSESWIEDTIDAYPRLLRLVPRLYGIGDLSQILSYTIERQTMAIIEDLSHSLRAFVPTDSYRRAELALHSHRFVVLIGPPASGKSAIAANLCMVSVAQDTEVRVMRIEHAEQFKSTWSPADAKTIYWVDDVFGETTLDEGRLREWSAALEKVEAARRRGAQIIFCTRDYILSAAERRLKKSKAEIINDARIRVDVTALTPDERDAILYNYIKDGDISGDQKRSLKKYLPMLARLASFSPELARRLGNRRFNHGFADAWSLHAFFEKPVQHFRDMVHGLSGSETAALAVCLLSNNSVADPIPDDALAKAVLETYGVSMQQVRESFEVLEGSLVKRVRSATTQTWQVHHPSMIEAMQEELATKSSQLILYLQSARLPAILRDTTTVEPAVGSRLVFLPESVYQHLAMRFRTISSEPVEPIAVYLSMRASDRFLLAVEATCPEIFDRSLEISPIPEIGDEVAANLAVRLSIVPAANLLGEERRAILINTLTDTTFESGWIGFLEVEGLAELISDFISDLLNRETKDGFPTIERLYDWCTQDLSSQEDIDYAIDLLVSHVEHLRQSLVHADLLSSDADAVMNEKQSQVVARLHEKRSDMEEDRRQDRRYGYSGEREWLNERLEAEYGRFADVDE
jgi:Novel STAND NTPase 3/Restriction endonuclease